MKNINRKIEQQFNRVYFACLDAKMYITFNLPTQHEPNRKLLQFRDIMYFDRGSRVFKDTWNS